MFIHPSYAQKISESPILSANFKKNDTLSYTKGWKIVPLPVFGYSSDLGFNIGAYASLIDYGDGTLFPDYKHQFEVLLRYNTNISGVGQLLYDSEFLIPKFRTTFNLTYMLDKVFPFYGFNGYESPYFADKGNAFYAYSRELFKFTSDLQKDIWKNIRWVGGFSFYSYDINSVMSSHRKDSVPVNNADTSLYDAYISKNVLSENERSGGNVLYFKVGFLYDTRDFERAPTKGIATELTFMGSPDFFTHNQYSHIKVSLIHRQYITLFPKRLVLAYRLAYQGTLVGNAPFYVQQNLHTIFPNKTYHEGVGGDATVRGILPNKVVGDGMFWANIESRIQIADFKFFKNDFYIALNPFFDCGIVTQKYKEQELRDAVGTSEYNFLSGDGERLHKTLGLGGKLAMNQNFILSLEVGFALDKRDGNYGIYAGMYYLF